MTAQKQKQKQKKKRLIVVTADKGGSGKTAVARAMADTLMRNALPFLAFDADKRNAQLHRHYDPALSQFAGVPQGVTRIDLSVQGGADDLLNVLGSPTADLVLLDLPAGGGELFERLEKEIRLLDFLEELDYSLTLVSVISRVKDCINSLRTLMEFCGDQAEHVVVKNGFFGEADRFRRFDGSKTKALLLQRGSRVMTFPDLYDDTFDAIDDQNLTFSQVLQPEQGFSMADRRRVKVFLDETERQMRLTGDLLGLGGK
ncbi:chromosome partitioning protein ParA [filamentous cyanobacterium LEGE 11480]|uniref:Chromosome partitioning protein ParA n=2 Tax=Romeriopsis TaxID=2992131 RepID=A0A928VQW1_9CYAN|nr:chromosome partitioning protein ParA [Romeriopsis navalis LEGE 11480]